MKTKSTSSKGAVFTGVIAALAASSCCIPPLIALIAGVGGASSSLSWMEPLRPYLIVLAVVAIGYAWYAHLKPKKADDPMAIGCGCEIEKPKFYQTRGFLVGMTIFAAVSITLPYYSHIFYGDNSKEVIVADDNNVEKITFSIDGMTCNACQDHVNHAVNELDGIVEVKTSYENENAIVEFDKTLTNSKEIEKAINSTGYTVIGIENVQIPHGESGHVCGPQGCN